MAAGLIIGNRVGRGKRAERNQAAIMHFWEFAAFLANSIIFILLGIALASQSFRSSIAIIVLAIVAVLAGRAAAVYPLSALFYRSARRVPISSQNILFWGGLRGSLAIALVLGVPESLPYRSEMLMATFGVVAFSVFVQGWTITPLMRYQGELPAKDRGR
jgi:CPA1 family monovalent cation:H+ antiporter